MGCIVFRVLAGKKMWGKENERDVEESRPWAS
jgi:hypothetical protein